MGDLFYPLGIGLTILAVLVSFWGLRDKSFPGSRGVLMAGIGLFAVLVVATAATAWTNAELEQDHREEELAEEAAHEAELEKEAEQAEEVGQAGGGAAGAELQEAQGGGAEGAEGQSGSTIDLTSPEDGSLVFDPESLEASAGSVTVSYTNPASVPHNVHIESDGEELAASEDVSDGDSTEATADLEAGEYTYFCSIPGHREGGMEGTLTVE